MFISKQYDFTWSDEYTSAFVKYQFAFLDNFTGDSAYVWDCL